MTLVARGLNIKRRIMIYPTRYGEIKVVVQKYLGCDYLSKKSTSLLISYGGSVN